MAIVDKRLCAGTLGVSNATIYTAPSTGGSYVIIKALTLCNKTTTPATATIKFDGVEIVAGHLIAAHDTLTIPFIDHIIEASELIEGLSGTASSINYYISGKEVA